MYEYVSYLVHLYETVRLLRIERINVFDLSCVFKLELGTRNTKTSCFMFRVLCISIQKRESQV